MRLSRKNATLFRSLMTTQSYLSSKAISRNFSLGDGMECLVGKVRANEIQSGCRRRKDQFKTTWKARDEKYQSFRKDYPTAEFVLAAFIGWIVFKLLLEGAVNRYTDNTKGLKAIAEHVDKQWEENYQLLNKLPAKESQAGFYLYTEPNLDKLKAHDTEAEAIAYQLQKNQRLLEEITAMYPNFLWRLVTLSFKPQLADTLTNALDEQAQQLTIAQKMNQALKLYKKRRYDDADDLINQTITALEEYRVQHAQKPILLWNINQVFASAYNAQGKLKRLFGDIQEAANAYDKALQLNPEDAVIMSNKALLLSEETELKEHAQALAYHQAAYRLDPHHPFVIANYGRGFYLQARTTEDPQQKQLLLESAMRYYNKALTLRPDNVIALLYRGILRLEKQDSQQALADFNTALRASPEHTSVLCRKAVVLAMMQQSPIDTLNDLESALANKADWLKDGDSKLSQVQTIRQQLTTEPIKPDTIEICNQHCHEIARFFYQRPNKVGQQANDKLSQSAPISQENFVPKL